MEKKQNKDSKQLKALITLLDDPDNEVFHHVSQELRSIGQDIIPTLENKWEDADNKILQNRIEELIHDIQFVDLLKEIDFW